MMPLAVWACFAQVAINYMIVDQGMDLLEEFRILTDDQVESSLVCKVLYQPGGTTGNLPPHSSSQLCSVNLCCQDEPQVDVLHFEVWREDKSDSIGD